MIKRINLWSGPRNISTAMMYSFAQRADTRVVDEPFYAYYLKKTGIDHPGRNETLNSMPCEKEEVMRETVYADYDRDIVFFKNMAHHFIDLPVSIILDFNNIFLIREPKYVINSYIKERENPTAADLAYPMLYKMITFLKNQGREVFLIDSKDILKQPKKALTAICDFAGISFDENMLSWEAGPIPEDGVWAKYWYKSLHKSTGFFKRKEDNVEIPERLMPVLRECENIYELLRAEVRNI